MLPRKSTMISQAYSKYFVATSQMLPHVFVILLSISSIYFLLFSAFFKITAIECYQDVDAPCQNSFIISQIDHAIGQNIFRFDAESTMDIIRRGDPTIRSLEYKKNLPGTLTLQIQTVFPTLALGTEGNSSLLILDADFRIIKSTNNNPNVPTVIYDQPLSFRVGERVADESFRQQLKACLKIAINISGTNNCKLSGDALTALLEDGKTSVVFTTKKNLDEQLSALHTILSGVTISGSDVVIDVRYQQPIIKGNN